MAASVGRRTAVLLVACLCWSWGQTAAQEYSNSDYGGEISPQVIDETHPDTGGDYEFPFAQGTRINYMAGSTSKYWGNKGELFNPTGRMPDWSWAGYRMGEQPIPSKPATYDLVKNFGAKPDDNLPDTAAFQKAFSTMPSGSILNIPAGTFIIDAPVTMYNSVVIRGAGRDATKIYLPKSFTDIRSWSPTPADPLSPYRDGPFFISFVGQLSVGPSTQLGTITANAWRGDTRLVVSLTSTVAAGAVIRIVAGDVNGNLVKYMYGNLTSADWGKPATGLYNASPLLFFAVRVQSVSPNGDGTKTLTLARRLPFDLKPTSWKNVNIYSFSPGALYETGIEDLTFAFAPDIYAGHLIEKGYNTLGVSSCVHCWFRRLRFTNCDIGLHLENSFFVTIDDVIINTSMDRTGNGLGKYSGHHGIRFSRTADCIARNVQFSSVFAHEITFDHMASLNVYHNIVGPDVAMDFHGSAPCQNLLSRINCGKCSRAWASGGDATSGGQAGLFNLAWGLTAGTAAGNMAPMWQGFGANFTIIGAPLNQWPVYNGLIIENLDPINLQPYDIQAAQLAKRMSGQ